MAMTSSVKSAQKRRKRKEAINMVIMVAVTVVGILGISWLEWHLFSAAEPWIRIVSIALGWTAVGVIVWRILVPRND